MCQPIILWQEGSVQVPTEITSALQLGPEKVTVQHLSDSLEQVKERFKALLGTSNLSAGLIPSLAVLVRYYMLRGWFRGHQEGFRIVLPRRVAKAEMELPGLFHSLQTSLYGARDPCSCVENHDFYLTVMSSLRSKRLADIHEMQEQRLVFSDCEHSGGHISTELHRAACIGGAAATYVVQLQQYLREQPHSIYVARRWSLPHGSLCGHVPDAALESLTGATASRLCRHGQCRVEACMERRSTPHQGRIFDEPKIAEAGRQVW
eukprot:TRINITY_DN30282_c0_g1_i1.p1 TRINITY_DN30282_c0_g1~~TRINITY_DN30282_c0_g1_i1.p1  ORF type:complete len:263 (+),score=33.58 TRINITY_DN30282_c0_g1_i1:197-985(+)